MKKIYVLLGMMMVVSMGWGQVSLTNGSPTVTIDFSSSTPSGVGTNPGSAFAGTGFEPNPTTAGRLNSNAWAVTGWSDGALAFGGTRITANTDYTRGATGAAVSTGGMYAYTGAPGSPANPTLMIQPGGGDWAPGTLTLRIQNNGTTNITQLAVSYNIYVRNDQSRSNSFNFSHSSDDITYTAVGALDYTSIAAADGLGWVLVGTAPSRSTTITGLNIAPGSYYYIRWSGADVGGTGSRDEFGLDDIGVTATFESSSTPDIALSSPNPAVAAGNMAQGSTNNVLYRFDLAVTTANATLTGVTINTAGTYAAADLSNLKCWYSADATFDAGTDVLLSTKNTALGAGAQVFPSFTNQVISNGSTGYMFITADVACGATIGNTLSVDAITTADITFSSGNKTGTAFAGDAQTITAGTLNNVTGLGATNGNAQSSVSWTNPTGCFNEIMIVVADGAPNNGTPTGDGTAYTANLAFGSGTALGNGFVVYKGSTSAQVITALTNGNTYYIKIFTRNGTNWSSGVETTATPVAPVLGLQLSAANTNYVIDFDNTVTNVNNGQFAGTGFTPTPSAGQLNSGAWAVTGMSDGDLAFGGTNTTGDYARGISTGVVSTGGIYAFTTSTGNRGLGVQPGGADWTPGTITLRVQNQTGSLLSTLGLAYKIFVLNDQGWSNSFNFSYSTDNITYTPVAALNYASPEAADGTPVWQAYLRAHTITGLSIVNGDFVYLRWEGDDVSGSGSRDEFALDDISIVGNPSSVYQSAAGNVASAIINGNTQLSAGLNVTGTMDLQNGRVFLGNNNLTVGSATGGNATNHIVTNGSGLFTVNSIGTGPVLLPVGNSTYNPISISNGESLNWSVRVEDAVNNVVLPFNTDKAINRTWHISHSGSVTTGPDIVFNFDDADAAQKANPAAYSGDPVRNAQIWHYNGVAWIAATGGLAMTPAEGPQQLTLSGFTSFSPFAIAKTSGPLPVNFVSFSGYREGSRNLLRWTTATESNNRGFEVQRSTDGINYSAIGFVNTQAPGGNSTDQLSYTFTDNAPAGLKQYYRLRQEDWSGTGKLSNIVLIRGSKPSSLSVEAIFPNPARSNVNLVLAAPVSDQVTIVLNDALGRTVMQRVVRVEPGSNTIPLDVSGLRSGSYFVRVVCSDGCEATGQLLKQ